jgi:hypothetical protein
MTNTELHSSARLSDPIVTSPIFAPRPENYALSSVGAQEPALDAVALECLMQFEEPAKQRVLDRIRMAAWQKLVAEYLRGYLQTSVTAPASSLPSELRTVGRLQIPGRTFPFASHLNLLESPIEGLVIDLDEFLES